MMSFHSNKSVIWTLEYTVIDSIILALERRGVGVAKSNKHFQINANSLGIVRCLGFYPPQHTFITVGDTASAKV